MSSAGGDMKISMSGRSEPEGDGRGSNLGREGRVALTREEFASHFKAASGGLWCIAVAVLGRRTEAEDVLQDAAAIALTKLDSFDRDTSFAAWMGEIVRNVARNFARKEERRRTSPTDPQTIDAVRPGAGPEARPVLRADLGVREDQAEFDDRLMTALGGLDETARICLLLRTLESLSYREISRVVGVPEGTAMSHVHRSRQALRTALANPDERGHHGGPRA